MTSEQQRLVLAEFDGWTGIQHDGKNASGREQYTGHNESNPSCFVPDYPNDITAMIRVAEKMAKERVCSFSALLQKEGWLCCFSGLPLSATSFKPNLSLAMCEAAVRALGKWEE